MRLVASIAAFALLSACAPTAPSGAQAAGDVARPVRQCFDVQQVRNFRQGEAGQIFVRASRDVYELNASGGCFDLDFANRLAIVPDGAGLAGGRVCTGDWARVVVPGATAGVDVCRARVSRVLTAAEVEGLPSRFRP